MLGVLLISATTMTGSNGAHSFVLWTVMKPALFLMQGKLENKEGAVSPGGLS